MAEEIITSTNVETATDHEYNASEIQVLKGLEAVRKRPGMYIGSTGERGLHHLVYEIVDNAIDEALAGYCNHIEVKILKNNIIQVTDNGRGIPVDIQADTGLPAVTVVYTILHAGGKFGGENSGYKVAGGLHGVGASVVNACSEWLTVNVRRDGHEYEQTFRRGDPDGPLKCLGTVAEGVTGTRVTFKPDPEMFKDTTVYNFETLEKRLREESFLNAGVKITLTDERELYTPVLEDGQEGDPCYRTEVMCYEGGIKSFVTYLGEKRNLEVLHPNVIYLKGQTERGMAEIALQYNSSYNELLLSFANNVNTPDGGTHEEGFRTSLTRVFNDYGRSHGLLKDKDENLSGSDVREGLICVISVKLQEAEFEGQTKAKLGNTEIRTLVSNMVYTKLMEFFEENPGVAKAIFEKATQAARARAAAKKARELVRRKRALEPSRKPGKLADFVVIDRDYMTCPEEEIKDIQALMTVSGGEVVYTKDTSEPTILWQGKPVTLLSGALIEQPGTIYASASDLAGNISAVLEQGEGTVTVTCGEQSAELPVKTVNGADYVPVRAFFEGIGYAVTWCPDSRTVSTSRMSTADTSEAAAQPPVDEYSFQLGNFDGTVGAFCDVIMTGAKELAFSDPFDPEDEPLLTSYVAKKCEGYGVKYYIDKALLLAKLFSTVEMDGQWVYILYADDAVLQEYLELKQEEKDMIAAGTYTE